MTRYLNMQTSYGVETVDQLESKDFETSKDFRKELSRLVSEYRMCNMSVYVSSRCDKSWNS